MNDINLKKIRSEKVEEDGDFVVTRIDDEEIKQAMHNAEPGETVKVSFSKFTQLVSRGDIDEIMQHNANEVVVVSTNLLADLATPSEDVEERKIPVIFSIGLVVGIILTYILFKYL